MGGVSGMHETWEMHTFWLVNPKKGDHLEDIGMDTIFLNKNPTNGMYDRHGWS
jgi:hypothetical protein